MNNKFIGDRIIASSPGRVALVGALLLFFIEAVVSSALDYSMDWPIISATINAVIVGVTTWALFFALLGPLIKLVREKEKFEREFATCKEKQEAIEQAKPMMLGLKETSASIGASLEELVSIAGAPSSGLDKTSASLQDFTVTLEELAKSAKQIANLAAEIADISQKSHELAQQAAKTLQFSQEALQNIQKSSNSITQRILDLNEKSREIGTILDIIETVVDKTDILALNAALEGTRAGDAGKGFSVVAKEMRRLSERVSDSTSKIKEVIRDIQTAINSSVIATEEGKKSTISGIQVVEKTAGEFESIFYMVKSIKDAGSQISMAIQQQTSATEQSVRSMNEISEVVRENAYGVKTMVDSLSALTRKVYAMQQQAKRLCELTPEEK